MTDPTESDIAKARELWGTIGGYCITGGAHALIVKALADARAEEREACAKLAEAGRINRPSEFERGMVPMLAGEIRSGIAEDIRDRGGK